MSGRLCKKVARTPRHRVSAIFPNLSLVGYTARGRLNAEFGPVIACSSGTSFFQPSLRDGVGLLTGLYRR